MDPSNPNSANSPLAEPQALPVPAPLQPNTLLTDAQQPPYPSPTSTSLPSQQLTATPDVNFNLDISPNVLHNPQPITKPHNGVPWKLAIGGLVILGVVGLIGLTTQDVNVAKFIDQILFFIGLVVAGLCGFSVARLVANSINAKESGVTPAKSPLMTVGIVLCAASVLLGFITLIPGVILIIMASRAQPHATLNVQPVKPMNTVGKIALVALSFLGGFIPAALLTIVLGFMVSQHACELTSSKCM